MSPTRRELLRMRWLAPEGPTPGQARAQEPTQAPLGIGCSAERPGVEAPPPWVPAAPAPPPRGRRG